MKRTTSNRNLLLIVIAAVYVVFAVVGGLLSGFSGMYFAGLGFLTFAGVVEFLLSAVYAGKEDTIRDYFFHLPIYYSGAVYFVLAAVVSVLTMTGVLPLIASFIVAIILFVILLLMFVLTLALVNVAKGTMEKVAAKNDFIRTSTVRVENIAAKCTIRECRIAVEALADEFRYSSPAWSESLVEIENKLSSALTELDGFVITADSGSAIQLVSEIKKLLAERNNICKLIK